MRRAFEARRRRRFTQSLRFRLTAGLLLLAACGCVLLYFLAMQQLDAALEGSVTEDLESLKRSTESYVRQYLMLEERNNDEEGLRACARPLAEELYASGRRPLTLYALDGAPLLSVGEGGWRVGEASYGQTEDPAFASALQGQSAYSLHYGEDGSLRATFVSPLEVSGRSVGLIGYELDYSALYRRFAQLANTLLAGTMAALLCICAVVLLFLNHILAPVRRLSALSSRVAAQMRQGNIPVPERGAPKRGKRRRPRDEVAELSENYDEMLRTVGEQFTRIGEDRVRILRLLDSRQAFYNNVTHELKTPLTTIQGYAQLLSQAGPEEKELFEKGLTHITHESARLHRMVIQLLEMGDSERGRAREPMDAAATLRSVAESMNLRAARYGCAIRFDGEEKLPILGREERVREVCINLLDNALKYGEAGEVIWALAERSGDYAALRVVNRGRGFSDAEAEKLFEPFYRADKNKSREMGSAGLGLPLCKKIVEEHGGRIRARCRGGYTLFEALFPLREGGEEA